MSHHLFLELAAHNFPICRRRGDRFNPVTRRVNRHDRALTALRQAQRQNQQPLWIQHLHVP